jgi:hypothetical protein
MSDSTVDPWIALDEAFAALELRMGLPAGLLHRPTEGLSFQEGGMMWFSDHPILVRETPRGLGFDRSEFEAILAKVNRVELGDA